MSSSYPGALDSFPDKSSSATLAAGLHTKHHNDLGDAIEAIQATLGVNPQGAYATVKAAIAAAGGGGATALGDLTDVDTTGATTGQVLTFDGSEWSPDASSAGTVTSTSISDSTATGRAVLTAADAATARGAIGAGTSNLAIGTTGTTAAAGNRAASTTAIGMVELATNAETTTGTDTTRAVTPAGVKAVADTKAATSHTHGVTDLTATGTRDATTYLRGDNTWATPAGGGGGVTDHGALTGLGDDDHTQYHTDARGDARYYTKSQVDSSISGLVPSSRTINAKPLSANVTLTAGDVGAATAAQGAKADTALQPATAQAINAKTGAYTLVASDAGKMVKVTTGTAADITVPSGTFTAGQRVDVADRGTARITFVGSGVTLNGSPSLVSSAQFTAYTIYFWSATEADVIGGLAQP